MSAHLPVIIGFVICLTCAAYSTLTGAHGEPPADNSAKADHVADHPQVAEAATNTDSRNGAVSGSGSEKASGDVEQTAEGGDAVEMLKASVLHQQLALQEQRVKLQQLQVTQQQQTSMIEALTRDWQRHNSESAQQITRLTDQVAALVRITGSGTPPVGTRVTISDTVQHDVTAAGAMAGVASTLGVTYVRWGRTQCNGAAVPLYNGYAAGNYATNMICLPDSPQWQSTIRGTDYWINGAEYMFHSHPFSLDNAGTSNLQYQNAPCVVCQVPNKSDQIMIPAMTSCPTGWTDEYSGYLVSRTDYGNYECLDEAPETIVGGSENENSYDLHTVRTDCPSIPCPPYSENHNIPCVVCTK